MHRRSVLWPDDRKKPPYGSVEIDWAHPLAQGMFRCYLFNEAVPQWQNLVTHRTYSPDFSGTYLTPQTRSFGPCIYNASTAAGVYLSEPVASGSLSGSFSFACGVCLESGSTGGNPVKTNTSWATLSFSNAITRMQLYDGAKNPIATVTATNTANALYHICGVRDTIADTVVCYRNGGSASTADTTTTVPSYASLRVCGDSQAYTISYSYAWSRALSASETLQLYAEPYCFLRPRIRRSYAFVGAAAWQYTRPYADIATGGWLNQSGSSVNLYRSISEAAASDAEYIRSPA